MRYVLIAMLALAACSSPTEPEPEDECIVVTQPMASDTTTVITLTFCGGAKPA